MPQDGSPPITLTINPNPQVTNVAASAGAFGRLGLDPRGTVQWNGGDNFSYFGHDWATNDNAQLEIFDDPQLGAAVRAEQEPDPPPDAVWTTTPRELIRDGAAPLYSSTTPDVALTPRGSATPPIPYDTWARPTHPLQFPPSVRAAGQNVMVLRSQETLTYGAEQGVAMGVKSGTIMGPVHPLEHSTTVRAEGSEVIRDGDAVWMNNRNNLGVTQLAGNTVANGPTPPEPEEEPGFWGSLWDGAGDAWDATKDAASDAAAAIGEFDRNHGAVLTRGVGVVQAVGGVGEAILGAGLVGGGGAASATGVGAAPGIPAMVGGAALWVNGWDNAVTGMRTAWTGEFQHNLMSEAIGGTAGALGASPETVESIMNTTDLASGALSIGGGVAATTRAAGRETLEVAARQVDEVAEATGQQTARVTRTLSARLRYLGRTPGKSSRTGREVRERMREEGTLRANRRTGADEFLDESGTWRPVDTPQTHMGHHPMDAVDYWNQTGRLHGPKSPEVRSWMLDSSNYRFEWGPLNSARGGATTSRYQAPIGGSP